MKYFTRLITRNVVRKLMKNKFISGIATIVVVGYIGAAACSYLDEASSVSDKINSGIDTVKEYYNEIKDKVDAITNGASLTETGVSTDFIIAQNNNIPYFTDAEKSVKESFEYYSDLDSLGRCQVVYANIGTDILPTEERGDIGHIKPSGWVQKKYPEIVDSNPGFLYNRCHLLAHCLGGNDNEKNLITGTRYFNVEGMLPYETKVVKYIEKTGNHVLYRVTPIYIENNLVASGVQIEAWSIEDNGDGICFNVYVKNLQPGIIIDYATGENWAE